MTRRLTAVAGAALMTLLAVAALWPSAPPPARAQTAPDVRLRETAAATPMSAGLASASGRLTLRLSSARLDEDSRALPDGADLTLLAQPTYVALPSAGPYLLRISAAITITVRDAGGRDIALSPAARLTFSQPKAEAAAIYRLNGDAWRAVQAATLGRSLVVQPVSPGTYALFAELSRDWPLQHEILTAVALNAARLVADDLATQP